MSSSPPKVEVVVPLDFSTFGSCLSLSVRLYFPYEGNREEHREEEKRSDRKERENRHDSKHLSSRTPGA